MEIAEDDGFAYFNDVLFVSLKNTFGYKLYGQKEGDVPLEENDFKLFEVNKKSIPIM